MIAESAAALPANGIYLPTQVRAFKGFAYGLSQPTLIGTIQVVLRGGCDFSAMDTVMAPFFDEPLVLPEGIADAAESLLHRLLHWHAAVQRQQKIPVFGFPRVLRGKAGPDGRENFLVAVPYHMPQATIGALNWARDAVNSVLAATAMTPGGPSRIREGFEQLLVNLQKCALGGINTLHLLKSAHILDIPTRSMLPGLFRFGEGALGRMLQSTLTDRTPAIGVLITNSKSKTAHILRQHGVPTPRHAFVTSAEQAVEQADKLGYPVVIKPDDQEQGRGVEAGLRDAAAVTAAYLAATGVSKSILLEKHCEGSDYRLTVFHGRVVKILHRRAGGVIGDGVHTVAELLGIEQQTPRFLRRLRQTGKPLMEIDAEAMGLLAEKGLSPESVPPAGDFIALRRKSNISAGGVQTLIPAEAAHPDNLDLAIRATRAVHLDLCGVDLIIPDIAVSWLSTGAAIIEMNSQPQIGIDKAPEVYQAILRELVQGDGRIPVHLVLCAAEADYPTVEQALPFMHASNCNGLSMAQGVWVGERQVAGPVANGFDAARIVLSDMSVTGAACIMTVGEILQFGLPADRFERIVILGHAQATDEEKASLTKALEMAKGNVMKTPPSTSGA